MEHNIERQEFNDIEMAREFAYQVGLLLEDKLGKMLVKANNYFPTDPVIVAGTVYTLDVDLKDVVNNVTYNYVIGYTAQPSDGVDQVLNGLAQWVVDNASDHMITNVYTDYPTDVEKHMFFLPKEGLSLTENSKTNLSSDPDKVWTEGDTPACYVGYGKAPTSSLPRVVITPLAHNTVCSRMEEGVLLLDGVEREFTSSYLDYSMNVTCEAGSSDDVLRSGISAQSILNDLRKRLVNEKMRFTIQNAMDSVVYPIMNITPLPLVENTQWMDISRTIVDFSCVDMFLPSTMEGAGFMEAVKVKGATVDDLDGTLYKYTKDGEVVIYGASYIIDRRRSIPPFATDCMCLSGTPTGFTRTLVGTSYQTSDRGIAMLTTGDGIVYSDLTLDFTKDWSIVLTDVGFVASNLQQGRLSVVVDGVHEINFSLCQDMLFNLKMCLLDDLGNEVWGTETIQGNITGEYRILMTYTELSKQLAVSYVRMTPSPELIETISMDASDINTGTITNIKVGWDQKNSQYRFYDYAKDLAVYDRLVFLDEVI